MISNLPPQDLLPFSANRNMLTNTSESLIRGRARIFQRGGGGSHCVKQRVLTSFCHLNIVGCLLKKGLQRGQGGSKAPKTSSPPVMLMLIFGCFKNFMP